MIKTTPGKWIKINMYEKENGRSTENFMEEIKDTLEKVVSWGLREAACGRTNNFRSLKVKVDERCTSHLRVFVYAYR